MPVQRWLAATALAVCCIAAAAAHAAGPAPVGLPPAHVPAGRTVADCQKSCEVRWTECLAHNRKNAHCDQVMPACMRRCQGDIAAHQTADPAAEWNQPPRVIKRNSPWTTATGRSQ